MTDGAPERDGTDVPVDGGAGPAIRSLAEELRGLRKLFDSKIRYDEVRERLVESMSDELDRHRQGFHQTLLRPVLLDLVSLHDDLTQVIDAAETPSPTAGTLAFFRDTVEQILVRNGVRRFSVDGDALDRARQQVVSTVDTSDPALGRTVARRLRAGFSWDENVLRPEWVSVHRHVAAAPANGAPEPDAPTPAPAGTDAGTSAGEDADVGSGNTALADHTEKGAPS
ncbi:nucleotide exchange factor GrpE [Actinomadura graeca]|uniref:Nucleotide exchange factor GrpE n=1 Tax=Actinomadura graeca TaxID=2750812 RepID=A0ABX8QSZ4_9ACTN|nr:nucleotide exchange factor GrpE [Actinomadura graeca]QXJ21491.1 nucleotide exchange factor GrpE [Actinomadura graeca]